MRGELNRPGSNKGVSGKDRNWAEILKRYESSGESQRSFSALEGIPVSTLRDQLGLRTDKRSISVPSFDSFIPLDLSGGSSIEVELEFRDGSKLRIKS